MNERQSWAEERLVSYLLDTLPANEAAEVEEILGGVEEYQGILEDRRPEDLGHLPASLLARWQRFGLHLVGVERVLVLQHLQGCESCREELELVGGSLQSWQDAPESAPREPMRPRPGGSSHQARVSVRTPWTSWLGGGLAGIAAGILLMLLLPPQEAVEPGLHGAALPVVVPQNLRGDAAQEIHLASAHAPLLLALVMPLLEEPRGAELVVYDPSGTVLSRTALRLGPDTERTAQIVLQPPRGWTTGTHTIELLLDGEDEPRDLGRFLIEIGP